MTTIRRHLSTVALAAGTLALLIVETAGKFHP
jgi:hypothetical protein